MTNIKELEKLLHENKEEPIIEEILKHLKLIQQDTNFTTKILENTLDEVTISLIDNVIKIYATSILFSLANQLVEKGLVDVE